MDTRYQVNNWYPRNGEFWLMIPPEIWARIAERYLSVKEIMRLKSTCKTHWNNGYYDTMLFNKIIVNCPNEQHIKLLRTTRNLTIQKCSDKSLEFILKHVDPIVFKVYHNVAQRIFEDDYLFQLFIKYCKTGRIKTFKIVLHSHTTTKPYNSMILDKIVEKYYKNNESWNEESRLSCYVKQELLEYYVKDKCKQLLNVLCGENHILLEGKKHGEVVKTSRYHMCIGENRKMIIQINPQSICTSINFCFIGKN